MPERLQRALERLERALAEQQHPVVRGLLPGVSETHVRRMLAMAELDPPDDLVTWFGWHNGYAPPPGEPFAGRIGPTLQPLGLEFAYDAYTELRYDIDELAPDEDIEWFPVVTFTHSGMILMYCGTDAERRGEVACWESEFPSGFYRPPTLAEPVEWWAELLEQRAWRCDPVDGVITADFNESALPRERRLSGML